MQSQTFTNREVLLRSETLGRGKALQTAKGTGQRATALLESSKCMGNSTIEFVFNPCGGEGAREGSIVTVHQGRLLFRQAVVIEQRVGWCGRGQVQVVLRERGRESTLVGQSPWPWCHCRTHPIGQSPGPGCVAG